MTPTAMASAKKRAPSEAASGASSNHSAGDSGRSCPNTNAAKPSSAAPKCDDVIKACDEALEEKNKALKISDIAIQQCQSSRADMINEIEDLRDEVGAWYRNPFIVGLLGAAAASTAYLLLRK